MLNSVSALVMLLLLCIPLASSLVTITRNIIQTDTVNRASKTFLTSIDERIELEHAEFERKDGARSISLTVRVPQTIL